MLVLDYCVQITDDGLGFEPAQADTLMVAMNLAALHHERGEYGKAEVCA